MLFALAGLITYLPTFYLLAISHTGAADSYYAHWFLIPPVSALLIWLRKNNLRRLPVQGHTSGLPIAAGGLLIHIFAVWFRIEFVSAFSLVVTVWGFALYLFGKRIVREISFPLLFLVFMVPLPQLIINPLAFHMKMLSGKLAVSLYSLLGGTAVLTGSAINFTEGEPLWMGYECSGLRSLITMAALGAAFAHLARMSRPRKVVLFLFSLPLAVLSNAIRVTSLCFAAERWGVNSKAFKVFHDASSPVVFIIVLVGLFGVHKLLSIGDPTKRREPPQANVAEDTSCARPLLAAPSRMRLAIALGLFAVSAILVFLSPHSLSATQWMSSLKPVKLPEHIGAWRKTSTEGSGNEGVWAMLNTKSIVLSTYEDAEGRELRALVVASDTHRDAFHPPDICMMAAGNEIVKSWSERLNFSSPDSKPFYLNAFVLKGAGDHETLVLYWFMVGERSMGSRLLQQLILLLNGARRTPIIGSMIRVTVPLTTMSRQEALHSAKDLSRSLVPLMPGLLKAAREPTDEIPN
mgnify:CR=1 FL=1